MKGSPVFYFFRAESAIFECIDTELKDCTNTNDAVVARDMLTETAETVRSMCELRVLSGMYLILLGRALCCFQLHSFYVASKSY